MSIREDLVNEIIGVGIVILSFVCAATLMDYHRFTGQPLTGSNTSIEYEVKPGDSITSLSRDFQQRGWIRHALYLKFFAKQHDLHNIKAGLYEITPELTVNQVLNKFINAEVILEKIVFIEGWTAQQMLQSIKSHPSIKQTLPADDSLQQVMASLGKADTHPEGQFMPDTYAFAKGSSDIEILQRAHEALLTSLHTQWENRTEKLPLKTPYEALILASIVEKETGLASERPLIAGVFISRLRKGMKLQTDPTVIYGMGERYNGNIRKKDLREDTPYKTYVHTGLTPSPISLAGHDAIRAATHPDEQGYIYFVAKGDGSHYFSRTLKEHNAAVRKYQLKK